MNSLIVPAYNYADAYLISRPKRNSARMQEFILSLKHLPGQHDQRSHGRSTARRQAYRSAYSQARADGASIQEARAAAREASRVELQKKLDERRANRAQRTQQTGAGTGVTTQPLVDTGGKYRAMDPDEVVSDIQKVVQAQSASLQVFDDRIKEIDDARNAIYKENQGLRTDLMNLGISTIEVNGGVRVFKMAPDGNDIPTTFDQLTPEQQSIAQRMIDNVNQSDALRMELMVNTQQRIAQKDTISSAVHAQIAENLRHPDPYMPPITFTGPGIKKLTPEREAQITAQIHQITSMFGNADVSSQGPIAVNLVAGRAQAGRGMIYIPLNEDNSTIWHETLHIMQERTVGTATDTIPHEWAIGKVIASGEKKPKPSNLAGKIRNAELGDHLNAESSHRAYEASYVDSVDRVYALKVHPTMSSTKTPFVEALTMAFTHIHKEMGDPTDARRDIMRMGIRAVLGAGTKVQATYPVIYFTKASGAPTTQQLIAGTTIVYPGETP